MIKKFFALITNHRTLITILILAAALRLWGLGTNPPHLTSDEAALGYNAYSILKTGRDEHGQFLPIVFESFGDWKPGLYVYLAVPFVATLGLTELAVRLPGALFGALAVWLLYLVVSELFRDTNLSAKSRALAVVSSFFLAVSPWHLQFSRGAWEAGVSLTLTLAGIYLFLRSVRDKPRWLAASAAALALTLWTYQGAKLSSAIVVFLLILIYRRRLFRLPQGVLVKSLIAGLIVAMPILLSLAQGKAGRLEVFSVFSYPRKPEDTQVILEQGNEMTSSLSYLLYHSQPQSFALGILERWFNHFSPRFLLFEGDWSHPRHGVPHAGTILLLDGILLALGLIALSRLGSRKAALFLWGWLLLAPLPAALSRDSIHAVRSLNMVVPLAIILALGVNFLWEKRKLLGKLLLFAYFLFPIFYSLNYLYYLDQYWIHAPKKNSASWQYGYKQVVERVAAVQGNYKKVVVQQSFDQPYIFFLFYQTHNPANYQQIEGEVFQRRELDVGFVSRIENIEFREINWPADSRQPNYLLVAGPIKIGEKELTEGNVSLIEEIKYLDGGVAFGIVETK